MKVTELRQLVEQEINKIVWEYYDDQSDYVRRYSINYIDTLLNKYPDNKVLKAIKDQGGFVTSRQEDYLKRKMQ